uniref:Uncharacterized protein n=1 Tax=Tanacetum cinerariifolium TaxID=118510 RepID=A0A699H9R1_TANCI|nr:hypothetical protein [Tanacetum cinerariifolium]
MDQPLSSPEPLLTVDSIGPRDKNPLGTVAKTAESRGDHSLHIPRYDSTNTSVHNYVDIVDENEETNSLQLQSFASLSLARGAFAQKDILERNVKDEHDGCVGKFQALESERDDLASINND